jgi:type IV pilus assembly protein PilN
MIRVNLLAPGSQPAQRSWKRMFVIPPEQRAALIGLAMLMTTAAGAGLWWWSISLEHKRVDREIASAEANLTKLQEAARLMEKATAREKDLRERLALIDRLRGTQRAPVMLLDTISRSLAEGLWLTEMRQTGAMVQLEGRAISLSALTEFLDRLQLSGRFVRPLDIVTTTTETVADSTVTRFIIRGEVGAAVTAATAVPAAPAAANGNASGGN